MSLLQATPPTMNSVACLHKDASFFLDYSTVYGITGLPGGRVATGHSDMVSVWDDVMETPTELPVATCTGNDLACGPGGEVIVGSWHGTAQVWHGSTCLHTLHHTSSVWAVAASPLDGTFVSGSKDQTAKVWRLSSGECVATLEGHTNSVSAVCVLENGDIVTGSWDKTVRVWTRGSWTCAAVHGLPSRVDCLASVSRTRFVAGGPGFVSLWRDNTVEWSWTPDKTFYCVAVQKDMVVACFDKGVSVIQDGVVVGEQEWDFPHVTTTGDGRVAIVGGVPATCLLFRVVRPSRLAAIHIMVTAWGLYGGVPPAPADTMTAVGRTVCLRRFCRPRGETGVGRAWEVVEPFGRDIVGFL